VISVGNLSHGGRGKTPLVAMLARLLRDAGERPAILTRGYARRRPEDGVVVVSDGGHVLADLDRSGDEPLMLARSLPGVCVLVGEQRALAGTLAERALGATVHLLDDGFQHLQLARDIDLVVVTRADLTARAIPFGPLREAAAALEAADAVIVDGVEGMGAEAGFALRRRIGDPVPIESGQAWAASDRRVVAVAGIANPQRFPESLRAAGWNPVEFLAFGDHHAYTRSDIERLDDAARRASAPVLTTAKDAVRLLRFRPLPMPAAFVPLDVTVEPEAEFRAWLLGRLAARRSAA
jgi:tetraacyldisaccharide 4'-kinase